MSVVLTKIYTVESPRAQTYNITYTDKSYFIKEKVIYFLLYLDLSMWSQYRESVEKHILDYLTEQINKKCYLSVEVWLVRYRHEYDRHFRTPQRNLIPIGTVSKPKWKSKFRRNMSVDESDDAAKFYSQTLNKVFAEIGT